MAVEIKKINGVYMGSQEIASTRFAGDANIVQYNRFEGNSTATVGSNGTDSNITYSASKFNLGAGPTGTSAPSITINNAALNVTTGDATWNVWINSTSYADDLFTLFYLGGGYNVSGYYVQIYANGAIFFFSCQSGASQAVSTPASTILANNTYFISIVKTGTNVKIYVNGNLSGNGTITNPATGGNNLILLQYGAAVQYRGPAIIDDFSVFSRALTSDEIYSLYKTGVKKLNGQVNLNPELESTSLRGDANLVQYTRFEGNSTATVGGNGTDTDITYSAANGKFGQGALFNGTSSKVTITNTILPSSATNYTILAWINPYNDTNSKIIISDRYGVSNYDFKYRFYVEATTKVLKHVISNTGNTKLTQITSTGAISPSVWTHVAVTVNVSGTCYLYINGIQDGSASYTADSYPSAANQSTIGVITGPVTEGYFKGSIDDVAIFSRALTATEISNLYNTNIKKFNGISNV